MVLTTGRALGMFLVSLLYERKCLRIDLFKINFRLNVPFIVWFLYVLNSITFVLHELQCSCRVFIALADSMAGTLSKRFASFDTVCFGHRSGALCRYF